MRPTDELRRHIKERAADRCEYCGMHQSLQGATFHVEHVVPRHRGGVSASENLAWACPGCNLHKSNRVEVPDPESGKLAKLFNPRSDKWSDHFRWEDYRVLAKTSIGRATVAGLDLNHQRRIQIRQAEEVFDLFPPPLLTDFLNR